MANEVQEFVLPILGWTVFQSHQGWRLRFPDGREAWPDPRERQIILAFHEYATKGAAREESAPLTPCRCVQRMNDALRETFPGARLLTGVINNRPILAVNAEGKRRRTPIIFASFCPFCGRKYED